MEYEEMKYSGEAKLSRYVMTAPFCFRLLFFFQYIPISFPSNLCMKPAREEDYFCVHELNKDGAKVVFLSCSGQRMLEEFQQRLAQEEKR